MPPSAEMKDYTTPSTAEWNGAWWLLSARISEKGASEGESVLRRNRCPWVLRRRDAQPCHGIKKFSLHSL